LIKHLSIRDFAIIDRINVDFHEGLNILTGETGAGKSIIIEAVSLALGSRADTAFVRSGKDKSVIQLVVTDKNNEELIITREVFASGKSSCRINDNLVTLSHLSAVCRDIADIHGQYDHQSLLNADQHINLVDAYESDLIQPVKDRLLIQYKAYEDAKKQLANLLRKQADGQRRKEFMAFENQEIQSAKLTIGEDEALGQHLMLLQNSEKIASNLSAAYELLYAEETASLSGLIRSANFLKDIAAFSPSIAGFESEILDSYYKLEDIAHEIKKYLDQISYSPAEINETISRLELIDGLKRKYGGSISAILDYEKKNLLLLDEIEHSDESKTRLQTELIQYERAVLQLSSELSGLRKTASLKLENKINAELMALNFSHAALSVSCVDSLGHDGSPILSENGIDRIEFLISTNKGEPPKPLAKIASGGEISRIMLAFKRIIGDYDRIPTMIFDEIDSGISGATASIVGKKLLEIAKTHQIICITHLPQIAATGDHNFKIDKLVTDQHTATIIAELDPDTKIMEIARLLGGMSVNAHTIKNAEDLIQQARL